MSELKVSKALLEVWEWKDAIYQEVKHLPTKQALRKIMENAEKTARKLNLGLRPASPSRHLIVAESPATYSVARRKTKRVKSGKHQ